MKNRIKKHRERAFESQQGRCYYCTCAMWRLTEQDQFCKRFAITERQARSLQCTAEHLTARCDGGTDAANNVVAACARCNFLRHARKRPISPPLFKSYVSKRVRRGDWHVFNALKAGMHGTSLARKT